MFCNWYRTLLCIVLLGAPLGALAQVQPVPVDPKVPPVEERAEATVTSAGAAVDPRSYRIGAEDVLLLKIWREPDLSGLFTVRPDGKINLQLVGELDAANLTPVELEMRIAKAYESVLKSPLVTLQVQRVESKRYFISGEVGRTGAFPLIRPITILEALTMAGGIREFGNGKKIVVMRGKTRLKFNYNDVIKGKKLEQNILLEPADHIVVP